MIYQAQLLRNSITSMKEKFFWQHIILNFTTVLVSAEFSILLFEITGILFVSINFFS